MTSTEGFERLKKAILDEYPRMTRDGSFQFACHSEVSCFNNCCADVNIFLTPYDVLRLKKRLNIVSHEFLDKYTLLPLEKKLQYPIILLKLQEDEGKTCHFVDPEKGCTVYEDRPWACRMYPIGLASPKEGDKACQAADREEEFFFLMKEEGCCGFGEKKEWTVAEWIENQGIPEYDEAGRHFKEVALHPFFESGKELTPEKMEMFFISCYNLDKFRDMLFKSTFFDRFLIEDDVIEKIRESDEELLEFSFQWLRFSLFGEKTIKVKPGADK